MALFKKKNVELEPQYYLSATTKSWQWHQVVKKPCKSRVSEPFLIEIISSKRAKNSPLFFMSFEKLRENRC